MDAASFNHGFVGLHCPNQTVPVWAEEEQQTTRQSLSLVISSFLLTEPDANWAQPLFLNQPSFWSFLLSSCVDRPWISCGRSQCLCLRCALPFPWMQQQGATVCSPVSPSPCVCVRGCPTTPLSCPTYWTTTTSKPLLSPWRYSTLLMWNTCKTRDMLQLLDRMR